MQQETGTRKICINDLPTLNRWLTQTLQPALDLVKCPRRSRLRLRGLMLIIVCKYDFSEETQIELIYNTNDARWSSTGIRRIIGWLTTSGNWEADEEDIKSRPYRGNSGLGEPNSDSPQGLAVVRVRLLVSLVCRILLTSKQVQWLKSQREDDTSGTLQVFFNSDTPIREKLVRKKL